MPKFLLLLLLTGISLVTEAQIIENDAVKAHAEWLQKREAGLKAENGWLNLAGLYWLKPGLNTFGSKKGNALVFPEKSISKTAGTLLWEGESVWLEPHRSVDIRIKDEKVINKTLVFGPEQPEGTVVCESGSLRWTVIKRGDRMGVRLRDLNNPTLTQFKGITAFPYAQDWVIPARFEVRKGTLPIANVLGQTTDEKLEGVLFFELDGQTYELWALDGGSKLFILFTDVTNGLSTYGSGRFLSVDRPDAQGLTHIDFNRAYNPPCAFTPYATCPLPPEENNLPFEVKAGETYTLKH